MTAPQPMLAWGPSDGSSGERPGTLTFGARLDPARNSLNALRLALALLVIVSHAPPAVGTGEPPMLGDVELGGWAVAGFFAISGWLITASRLRLELLPFIWRRCLRILPGFWVCLVVVALVLAPLTAWRTSQPYALDEGLGYILRNLTLHIFQPTVGDTLATLPYDKTWNLSLWTLEWEFLCYLGIALLLSLGWARRHRAVVLAAFCVVTIPYAVTVVLDLPAPLGQGQGFRLAGCFLFGAVMYLYRDRVRFSGLIALGSVVALVLMAWFGVVRGLGAAPLGYLTLWLAVVLPLHQVGRRNDISYGVYVYAFPVQLTLTAFGAATLGLVGHTAATIVVVVALAWLSWALVERPALRLKSLGNGRRPPSKTRPEPV